MITSPAPACDLCNGRKWVTADPVRQTVRRCECHTSGQADAAALRRCGLGDQEIAGIERGWDKSHQREPLALWAWAEDAARGLDGKAPSMWVLWGRNGRGKSLAAAVALQSYVAAGGKGALWFAGRQDIERVMAERRDGISELESRVGKASLLVIDEWGAERPDHSGQLDTWVWGRHWKTTPTIITTNEDPRTHPEGRLASRFADAQILEMVARTDYRQQRATSQRRSV